MQELEHATGGATLVISVGGLNWLHRRRCSDKEIKKRGGEVISWTVIQADEERRPAPGVRALHRDGSNAIEPLMDVDRGPCLTTRSSSCCLPKERYRPSTCSTSEPFVSWKTFMLKLPDIRGLTQMKWNMATHRDIIAKHLSEMFIVYCDGRTLGRRSANLSLTQDCRTFVLHPDRLIGENMSVELKDAAARWSPGPSSSSEEDPREEETPEDLDRRSPRGLLKSSQSYNHPGGAGSDAKLRKSVSFDDDVMVYVFDRERPTVELVSDPCWPLADDYSCNLQGSTVKDNGLEWEDDFSALEMSCHLQRAGPAQRHGFTLPTLRRATIHRPEHGAPSQRCLFLTYVAEADLEL